MNPDSGRKGVVLIGYSGHARVVHDALLSMGRDVVGYCERSIRGDAPLGLQYYGFEENQETLLTLRGLDYFISIGDNVIRQRLQWALSSELGPPINAIHASAVMSPSLVLGDGVFVGPGAVVNANSRLGDGVIVNTKSVVEHDCQMGDYVHLCPGAILTGGVTVGSRSFLGAGCVVIPGKVIGEDVLIGAGSTVISDLESGCRVVGSPARNIVGGLTKG